LHEKSNAVEVIKNSNAGMVLSFSGEDGLRDISDSFLGVFKDYRIFCKSFSPASINRSEFDAYSAKAISGHLAELLDKAVNLS
jgi:hypothetical protein